MRNGMRMDQVRESWIPRETLLLADLREDDFERPCLSSPVSPGRTADLRLHPDPGSRPIGGGGSAPGNQPGDVGEVQPPCSTRRHAGVGVPDRLSPGPAPSAQLAASDPVKRAADRTAGGVGARAVRSPAARAAERAAGRVPGEAPRANASSWPSGSRTARRRNRPPSGWDDRSTRCTRRWRRSGKP